MDRGGHGPEKVGFIGTGNIGRPTAQQLVGAGHEVVVCDLRAEAAEDLLARGASWADTPRELVARCDVVFTSLPGPPQLEAVIRGSDGLLAGARGGLVHVDLSTISLSMARRAASLEAEAGVSFVDSPVSGGKWAAEKGELTLMVSGPSAAYERVRPLLDVIGKSIFYLGESAGTGTLVKLVNNQIFLCASQLVQEGLVLGAKGGLDPKVLYDVLKVSSAGMYAQLAPLMLARQWESSSYDLALAEKDVALALESARDLAVSMPATAAAHQTLLRSVAEGLGGKFFIATLAALERASCVELPKVDVNAG